MRNGVIAALACALAACGSVPAAVTACPPVKPYSKQFQRQLAAELKAIADGSAVSQAIVDYGQLRAAARACAHHP